MRNIIVLVLLAGLFIFSLIREPFTHTADALAGATNPTYGVTVDSLAGATEEDEDEEDEDEDEEEDHD